MRMHTSLRLIVGLKFLTLASTATAQPGTLLHATLTGPPPMTAAAEYENSVQDGVAVQRLTITITNSPPLQFHPVFAATNFVGLITAGADGSATHLFTPADFEGDPAGFPTLYAGDSIKVGHHDGVFVNKNATGGKPGKGKYEVRGKATGPNGEIVSVKYRQHQLKPKGKGKGKGKAKGKQAKVDRRFELHIKHAAPNQSFDVFINGEFVGTLTTKHNGHAKWRLWNRPGKGKPPHIQPMPGSFPALGPGDVVSVGATSVVLMNK